MNILRISLCTMLLVSPIPSLVLPVSVAQAETPVFVGGLQDLLPGEPSIADGSTQATYYFVLLNVKNLLLFLFPNVHQNDLIQ